MSPARLRLKLSKETIRELTPHELRVTRGGATDIAACISAQGNCGTWQQTDCGACWTTEVCGGTTLPCISGNPEACGATVPSDQVCP
jgi:hypothetical protein